MVRTCSYFFRTRGNAFFSRLPLGRIERSIAMENVRSGNLKPWSYRREQVLGAPIALTLDYAPKPVRIVGTVMDCYKEQTSVNGGLKVFAKHDETNMMLWVPLANPAVKVELSASAGTFDHFLDERDRWDEAYMSGKALLK
eukprot:PhM_4_TR4207/c0_g1_i1/m.72595